MVRNGYQPEREVLTGIGPVRVQVPKTRDRRREGRSFRSELLPPYLKKARRVEAVLPWLYLKGVSTNDFDEALRALFGESVKGLSAGTITRLKQGWEVEYAEWRERDWHGIYVNVRSDQRRCLLVVVGLRCPRAQAFSGHRGGFQRIRGELEGGAVELAGPRGGCTEAGGRRRRAGFMVGPGRSVPRNPCSALLGPQDGQRPRQAAQEPARRRQVHAARDLQADTRKSAPKKPLQHTIHQKTQRASKTR